jgi:hypothetical protein
LLGKQWNLLFSQLERLHMNLCMAPSLGKKSESVIEAMHAVSDGKNDRAAPLATMN